MNTWQKLKSGEWGVRIEGPAQAQQSVTVSKRDGTTQTVQVSKIVWTDGQTTLAAVVHTQRNSGSGARGGCAECGRGGPLVRDMEDGLMKHWRCCDIPPEDGDSQYCRDVAGRQES